MMKFEIKKSSIILYIQAAYLGFCLSYFAKIDMLHNTLKYLVIVIPIIFMTIIIRETED